MEDRQKVYEVHRATALVCAKKARAIPRLSERRQWVRLALKALDKAVDYIDEEELDDILRRHMPPPLDPSDYSWWGNPTGRLHEQITQEEHLQLEVLPEAESFDELFAVKLQIEQVQREMRWVLGTYFWN